MLTNRHKLTLFAQEGFVLQRINNGSSLFYSQSTHRVNAITKVEKRINYDERP